MKLLKLLDDSTVPHHPSRLVACLGGGGGGGVYGGYGVYRWDIIVVGWLVGWLVGGGGGGDGGQVTGRQEELER